MANVLRHKRSSVASKVPTTTDIDLGELAINTNDGRAFIKRDNGTPSIVELLTNLSTIPSGVDGLLDVVSAAGTTTLTSASPRYVRVTGTLTQTVVLPDVSTIPLGTAFTIHNASAGQVFIQSSGLNGITSPVQSHIYTLRSVATTGTGAAAWQAYAEGTGSIVGTGNMMGGFRPTIAQLQVTSSTAITAGTNAQGQGTLSESFNVITTAANNPSGATLPAAGGFGTTASRLLVLVNKGANPVNVYPATGGQIDALGTNVAISLPVGGVMTFWAASTLQWYSSYNQTGAGLSGTLGLTSGGTNAALTADAGGVVYSGASALAITAAGSAGQALISNGTSAPSFQSLTLENLPGAWLKRAVRAATTANITLSAPQTLDGIAVVAGDRVLVKNQTAPAENGIYVVAAGAWARAADADAADEIAGAQVSVDQGTTNGGKVWDTDFRSTDTLGTTAMNWGRVLDTATIGVDVQAYSSLLNSAASLTSGTGLLKLTAGVASLDTSTYLTSASTIPATNGGTGQTGYAVGDLLYASTTTALSKLADVATGNALISGGVGVAPSWGKVGLTTHVSGSLPLANGGHGGTDASTARTNLGLKSGATVAITVSTTAPGSPATGDLWVDTN